MYDISIKLISFILPTVQFIMSYIFDELVYVEIQMEMLQTARKFPQNALENANELTITIDLINVGVCTICYMIRAFIELELIYLALR